MYRAIGLAALRRHANLEDERELAYIARLAKIVFDFSTHPPGVTAQRRTGRASSSRRRRHAGGIVRRAGPGRAGNTRETAAGDRGLPPKSRHRRKGPGHGCLPSRGIEILSGRHAYRARPAARGQLRARGEVVDIAMIQHQIMDRDSRDARRAVGPLAIPGGAEVIDTTDLPLHSVVDQIVAKARKLQKPS